MTNFTSCPSCRSWLIPSDSWWLFSLDVSRLLGLGLGGRSLGHDAPSPFRRPEPAHVDAEVADLVVENPLGGVEQARRLRAIPARRLERVLDQIALEPFD